MRVEHFTTRKQFKDLVQNIKEFVEIKGNKIKFVDLKFVEVNSCFNAVLIYVEVSEVHGGPR